MTVVVGYLPRPEGRAALDRAIQEASLRDSPLHIVRGWQDSPSESPSQAQAWANSLEEGHKEARRVVSKLASQGLNVTYDFVSSVASPAQQILDAADKLDASLIVVGIRRRSPVGKLVLGSVSQDVLLGANCPVLAVKGQSADF